MACSAHGGNNGRLTVLHPRRRRIELLVRTAEKLKHRKVMFLGFQLVLRMRLVWGA